MALPSLPFTADEIKTWQNRYDAGEGTGTIARSLNLPRGQVHYVLKRAGTKFRKRSRHKTLDETAFDDVMASPVKQYVVGLMMSDGYVERRPNGFCQVGLGFAAVDKEHLEWVRDFLGSNNKMQYRLDRRFKRACGFYKLLVQSRRLVDALEQYGIVQAKSLTAEARGGIEHSKWFWAGMVCGDGSIGYKTNGSPVIRLCGSRRCMEQFAEFCRTVTPTRANATKAKKNLWQVTVAAIHGHHLIRHLFADCPFALPRKLKVAQEILAEFSRWENASPRKRFDQLTAEEIVDAYFQCGRWWRRVAKQLKCHPVHLVTLRRRLGVDPLIERDPRHTTVLKESRRSSPRVSSQTEQAVIQCFLDCRSIARASESGGVCRPTVREILKRNGIPTPRQKPMTSD